MRLTLAAALAVSSFVALAAPAAGRAAVPYWSLAKVMREIDGTRISMPHRVVRVDSDSALCSGVGRAIRRDGVRRWRTFMCTYTTFTSRGIDRDLEFGVRVVGQARFVVVRPHWVGALR